MTTALLQQALKLCRRWFVDEVGFTTAYPIVVEIDAALRAAIAPSEQPDKSYPFYELKFIMRVLDSKGQAPREDWETAYGMALDVFKTWHAQPVQQKPTLAESAQWAEEVLTDADIHGIARRCDASINKDLRYLWLARAVLVQVGLKLPPVAQPEQTALQPLTDIDALAKLYASSYASPHHITFTVDGLRNMIAAQLIPAGMCLVPIEPTMKMIEAGKDAELFSPSCRSALVVYRAMLAAHIKAKP